MYMGFRTTLEEQHMSRISDKWLIFIFVALWGSVVAVADMNWPSHMGPSNVLVDLVFSGS
jgi:hypothetical protein